MKLNKTRITIILLLLLAVIVGSTFGATTFEKISNLIMEDHVQLVNGYGYNAELFKVFDNTNNVTCYIALTNTIRGSGIFAQCSSNFSQP